MTKVCMIMAIGPNGLIGKGDKLAWHSKNDFYHFVQQTKGWPCIFGATTFYSLPKYPLKNRLNIVVNIDAPEAELVKDPDNQNGYWLQTNNINTALNLACNYDKVFVCGGKSIYKYCLDNNLIDEIYLTVVNSKELEELVASDNSNLVYFPIDLFDYTADWNRQDIIYSGDEVINEEIDCQFIKFTRPIK